MTIARILGVSAAVGAAVGAAGLGVFLWQRRAKAATTAACPADPKTALEHDLGYWDWRPSTDLPSVDDRDVLDNWGDTPRDLRVWFQSLEAASKIPGAGRLLCALSFALSALFITSPWDPYFRRGDNPLPDGVVAIADAGHRAALDAARAKVDQLNLLGIRLKHAEAAAAYGRGGLFGLLAPDVLAAGAAELGDEAPLLGACPEVVTLRNVSAFAAVVRLKLMARHLQIDDLLDVGAGWLDEQVLLAPPAGARGTSRHEGGRAAFARSTERLGIDVRALPGLDTSAYPGDRVVYERLVGHSQPVWRWT